MRPSEIAAVAVRRASFGEEPNALNLHLSVSELLALRLWRQQLIVQEHAPEPLSSAAKRLLFARWLYQRGKISG